MDYGVNYHFFLFSHPFNFCKLWHCVCKQVATRVAYGTGLAKLGKNNPRVIGMDGDTKNSTFSVKLKVR